MKADELDREKPSEMFEIIGDLSKLNPKEEEKVNGAETNRNGNGQGPSTSKRKLKLLTFVFPLMPSYLYNSLRFYIQQILQVLLTTKMISWYLNQQKLMTYVRFLLQPK